MIFKLSTSDAFILLHKPESGLGYQVIDAILPQEPLSKKFVVYNSELAINLDDNFDYYRHRLLNEGYSRIINARTTLTLHIRHIILVKNLEYKNLKSVSDDSIKNKKRQKGGKGAKDNQKESANGDEVFVRLSAFDNDKRIDLHRKRLMPGTFTTTLMDYTACVSTKDDPIDRYALPNDEKIKWAFYIQPKKEDTLQRGVVQPAFNHEGGGLEAYFEHGTSDHTYLFQKAYGQF